MRNHFVLKKTDGGCNDCQVSKHGVFFRLLEVFFTVLIPETGKVTDSNLLNAWPKKNICKKPLPKKPWDRDASLPKNFPQKGSLSTGIFFTNAASPTKKPWWEKPHDVATVAPHPRRPKRQDLENTWPMRWGILGRIFGLDFELDVL